MKLLSPVFIIIILICGIQVPALASDDGQLSIAQTHSSSEENEHQSVTFDIENMTCATCPITVRTAMRRVAGVEDVDVNFEEKTATVIFNPSVTNAETVGLASTNAGYPAHARSE